MSPPSHAREIKALRVTYEPERLRFLVGRSEPVG